MKLIGLEAGRKQATRTRTRRRTLRSEETKLALVLVAPSLALIVGLVLFPLASLLWTSLHTDNFMVSGTPFVGLNNYQTLLNNADFWSAVGRTFYFAAASLILQTILGSAIAMLLNQQFHGRRLLRTLIIVPWAIPTVVNAVLWMWIFDPNVGALNGILRELHVISQPVNWLGTGRLALNMVVLADTWRMVPLYVLMFLAALQSVSDELYDAANVDGAGFLARFVYITFPALVPTLLVVLVLRTIQAFRVFDIIYIMTQGGPANGTMVISFLTYYDIFKFMNNGAGAAVGISMTVIILGLSLLYVRGLRQDSALAL